jgi:hypothetical protein
VSIVQDCQARMFSAYRSRIAGGRPTPVNTGNACVTPPSEGSLEEAVESSKGQSKDIVSAVYQAPTPQNIIQLLPDMGDIKPMDIPLSGQDDLSFSDSAYSSNGTLSSQVIATSPQGRGAGLGRFSDREINELPIDDYGSNGFARGLSFEESYDNITLDMNDPNFDWWINHVSDQ